METAGTTGVVEIQDKEKSYKKKRIQFELGVDIDFAPGKVCILPHHSSIAGQSQAHNSLSPPPFQYGRTKVVTFTPRLVLVNHLDEPIYYKQKGFADMQYILPANSRLPFHWLDLTKENREIAVCRGEDWHWYATLLLEFAHTCGSFQRLSPLMKRSQDWAVLGGHDRHAGHQVPHAGRRGVAHEGGGQVGEGHLLRHLLRRGKASPVQDHQLDQLPAHHLPEGSLEAPANDVCVDSMYFCSQFHVHVDRRLAFHKSWPR